MIACDFFTVETVFLRRLYVLVFIELATRKIYLAGVTANPTGAWATQQARNIIETFIDRSEPIRFLIRDRDSKFTAAFDEVLHSETIRIIRTPTRAPRANAFTEFVHAVRKCLVYKRG
jgi:putative transposase